MTFARKGTRRIVVREETYHWKEGSGITVERPGGGGSRLHAGMSAMPWMNHAEPKNVADIIAYALDHGWEPNRPGKTFEIPDGISVLPEYPIFKAVKNGDVSAVTQMLASGISPNTRFQGGTLIQAAIWHNRTDILRLLLEAGADPNATGHDIPPLIYATFFVFDRPESVALLLAHGARAEVLDSLDSYGQTAPSIRKT